MIIFVASIIIICSGVFLMFSGNAIYAAFVMFGGSVALLGSVANMSSAIIDRAKNKFENSIDSEKKISDEGVRRLDEMSKDCKRVEKDAGVPAR